MKTKPHHLEISEPEHSQAYEEQKRLLSEKYPMVDSLDEHGRTPLMRATIDSQTLDASILLEKKADVNLQDSQGKTALQIAMDWKIFDKSFAIVQLLVESKANINISSGDPIYPTILIKSIVRGKFEFVSTLLAHHADVNVENDFGASALRFACGHSTIAPCKTDLIKLLLLAGANYNKKCIEQTPLDLLKVPPVRNEIALFIEVIKSAEVLIATIGDILAHPLISLIMTYVSDSVEMGSAYKKTLASTSDSRSTHISSLVNYGFLRPTPSVPAISASPPRKEF